MAKKNENRVVVNPEDAIAEGTRAFTEGTLALAPVRARADVLLERAKTITKIKTQADRDAMALSLVTNKDLQAEIRKVFAGMKQATHLAHQSVCDQETEQLSGLVEDEVRIKRIQTEDNAEQERVAEEKRVALQKIADDKAEEDRKKEVKALKASGQGEEARALVASGPAVAAPVQVVNRAQATASAAGLTFKVQRHMEVVDASLLDRKFLMPNLDAIKAAGALEWETVRPTDPKDSSAYLAAAAKYAASQVVKGVRFWVTKESVDTGRRR